MSRSPWAHSDLPPGEIGQLIDYHRARASAEAISHARSLNTKLDKKRCLGCGNLLRAIRRLCCNEECAKSWRARRNPAPPAQEFKPWL